MGTRHLQKIKKIIVTKFCYCDGKNRGNTKYPIITDDIQDYMNTCKDKIGLANKVNISNNSDPNEDNTCIYYPIRRN